MQHLYRLIGLGLGATLVLAPGTAGAASGVPLPRRKPALPAHHTAVPLPRPRPAIAPPLVDIGIMAARKAHIRNAGPDLARGRVPLPRPKPSLATISPMSQEGADRLIEEAVHTDGRGRVVVSLPNIVHETDPGTTGELSASDSGSWSRQAVEIARLRCIVLLATTNIVAEIKDPIGGPDGCGIASPIEVTAFGAIEVKPPAILNCTLAAAVYRWVREVLQPAAVARFKRPVFAIRNASSYACRRRYNSRKGRISEHAFGNALDVSGFELSSGRMITVENGWVTAGPFTGLSAQASFLKDAHDGACGLFSTVLGPGANAAHRNHFHLDLGRDGRYKICK